MRPGHYLALVALLAVAAGGWWYLGPRGGTERGASIDGGDGGGLPRAAALDEHVAPDALEAVRALAQRRGVDALLVARHGHLLLEYYAAPAQQSRLRAGGAVSEALLAQLGDARPTDAAALSSLLSTQVWRPLNAHAARLAAGQVAARADDWLRFGILLLGSGSFEGTDITSAERIADVRYAPVPPAGEAPAARDLRELRGPGNAHLWLSPVLQLALWHSGGELGGEETQLVNAVVRAIADRPGNDAARSQLSQLVPGH